MNETKVLLSPALIQAAALCDYTPVIVCFTRLYLLFSRHLNEKGENDVQFCVTAEKRLLKAGLSPSTD